MKFENFERGYLLPNGCKDLMDVIDLQSKQQEKIILKPVSTPNPVPEMKGDLLVSEQATIGHLAALLGQEPFKIIADAMLLGVFPTVNHSPGFEAISKIAGKYGYIAQRRR